MTPAYARAAGQSSGFAGRGVTSFVRGIPAYAGIGGFGGWEGNEYTGPFGETTIDYTYGNGETEPPHAVMSRSSGDTFSYDANGNMTSRTQDGVTWTQVFDAENRLVSVSNNATPSTTTYVYLVNWYYGYDPRNVELTADAIANLALNAFIVGDDGLKCRGHVLDWGNQNIETFIDNTAACVSGQNSCD